MRSMQSTPRGKASFANMMGSMIAAASLSAVQALAAWPVLVGRHTARQGRCIPDAAESPSCPACSR